MLRRALAGAAVCAAGLIGAGAAEAAAPVKYRAATAELGPFDRAAVACPRRRAVAGGGAALELPPLLARTPWVNSTHPEPDPPPSRGRQWLSYGANAEAITSHVTCLRRDLGRPRLVAKDFTILDGATLTGRVACPGVRRVTGGGVVISGAVNEAIVRTSSPFDRDGEADFTPDDGWQATGTVVSDGPKTMTVYALCLRRGRGRLAYRKATGLDDVVAPCPAGAPVVGGGIEMPATHTLIETRPFDGADAGTPPDDGWLGDPFRVGDETGPSTAYAICRRGG